MVSVATSTAPLGDQYWSLFVPHEGVLLAMGSSALDLTQAVKDALGIKATAAATAAPKATGRK